MQSPQTSVLNDFQKKRMCRIFEAKLNNIKKHIIDTTNYAPFECIYNLNDTVMLDILNRYGLQSALKSYNKESFRNEPFEDVDMSSLTLYDIVQGYYNIDSFKRELKQIKVGTKVTPVEIEFTYTLPKWNRKLFQVIFPYLNFDTSISFLAYITSMQTKINRIMKSYGFNLPSMEQLTKDLTEYYSVTRIEKRQYLPSIKELKDFEINDTTFLINYVHGGIGDVEYVDIPANMDLFRILASEFGSLACTRTDELANYITKINHFLEHLPKNTHRNNIKMIKRIISTLLKKTKDFMVGKRQSIFQGTEKERLRYVRSLPHVNHFKGSPMIVKQHTVYLNKTDPYYGIVLVHPRWTLNLLDYVDVEIINGAMWFNTSQIIDLIKSKYVLFIDLSCSSSTKANATNENLNHLKTRVKEIEGPSITKELENYLDLSPFNKSISRTTRSAKSAKHLSLSRPRSNPRSRSRMLKKPRHQSLQNRSKSRRYKSLTKTRTGTLKLPRVMNL
uniref:Uncharacterized protein n=1 Tax=viral metagenome TaxID=1070528 RepID=A0A6C0D1R4_9ZZZZ